MAPFLWWETVIFLNFSILLALFGSFFIGHFWEIELWPFLVEEKHKLWLRNLEMEKKSQQFRNWKCPKIAKKFCDWELKKFDKFCDWVSKDRFLKLFSGKVNLHSRNGHLFLSFFDLPRHFLEISCKKSLRLRNSFNYLIIL